MTARQVLVSPLVFVALGLARATVLSVPFRIYAPIFGDLCEEGGAAPAPSSEPSFAGRRARHIGGTIEAVARFTPWNSNCLAQAIVAAVCLRIARIGYSVHFGMATSDTADQSIEAHAWVMAGAYPVTGYAESQGMTCLQTFRLQGS